VDRPNITPGFPNSSLGGRLVTARRLVTLKCSTFKLKLTNTSMMMCKASVIDKGIANRARYLCTLKAR
jgi:hypothetical protein